MSATAVQKAVRPLTYDELKSAVSGSAAAFRCRRRLQPGGGEGDKVFPPTFAGAVYAVEQRRVPGKEQPVTCVLLDSVQSQANRMEQALQDAIDAKQIELPLIVVDFSEFNPTGDLQKDRESGRLIEVVGKDGKLTSLQVPHRLADAILRDSEYEGKRFRDSEVAKGINQAGPLNATALYQLCPTALLFGMWDSTGPKGGLGIKFERAMVSEVIGFEASISESHRNRGVRRDPLEASKAVPIQRTADGAWEVAENGTRRGLLKPSEINHGSVPFESENAGTTIAYAEQMTTLSLIALRRLQFPVAQPRPDQGAANAAAQSVLTALGLYAATAAFESGMGLRSRCLLWPDEAMQWELLNRPGQVPEVFTLDQTAAKELFAEAVAEAEKAGVTWHKEPVSLQPSKELVKLVRLSQQEAVKEGTAEEA